LAIHILRGGVTSPYWTFEGGNVSVSSGSDEIKISFSIRSKGGGRTGLRIEIKKDSFETVAGAMMKSDPKAAMKAFGAALQQETD
jgi:hypothetical protein